VKPILKWSLIVVALAGLAAVGASACKGKKKSGAPTYKAVAVKRGSLQLSIKSTGNVQPRNRLEVSPPVSGRVEKMLVREGSYVRKGQTLALISSSERAALLDAARAKGPEELAHWEDLYKATPLLAPMSGQVISRSVEPGQSITTGSVVVVLSDYLIVNAQVDETDIGRIRNGQKATLTLDAYADQPFPARVNQIRYEAKTVNNVTMYEVYVLPKNTPDFMRSGMTANVEFIVDSRENVLLVPSEAIRSRDGKSIVLLKGAEGERPQPTEVEVGLTDGTQTEVKSGLSEGDQVMVATFSTQSADKAGNNPFMPKRPSGSRGSGSTTNRRSADPGPPPM
jgi:macrolide-specific efflux system membrane fusion protein